MAILNYHKNSKVDYKCSTYNLASVAWSFHNYNITHFLLTHTRNGKFLSAHLALLAKYYLLATLQMTTFWCLSFLPTKIHKMHVFYPFFPPPTAHMSPLPAPIYMYLELVCGEAFTLPLQSLTAYSFFSFRAYKRRLFLCLAQSL